MATVHYRNAKILINGYVMSGYFSEFGTEYSAETLDETAFGDTNRIFKGGLLTGRITGKAHCEFGVGLEDVLFNAVGVDGTSFIAFPDGITVGAATGIAMLGVIDTFTVGGAVGSLLPIDIAVSSRGYAP